MRSVASIGSIVTLIATTAVADETIGSDYVSQFYAPEAVDLVSYNEIAATREQLRNLIGKGKAAVIAANRNTGIRSLPLRRHGKITDTKFTFGGFSETEIISEIISLADLKFGHQFIYNTKQNDFGLHQADYDSWVKDLPYAECATSYFLDVNADGRDEIIVAPVFCGSSYKYKFLDDQMQTVIFIAEENEDGEGIRLLYQGLSNELFFVSDGEGRNGSIQSGEAPMMIIPLTVKDNEHPQAKFPSWGAATVLGYKNGGYNFRK